MPSLSRRALIVTGTAAVVAGAGLWRGLGGGSGKETAETLYATPLSTPENPLNVYHLGHSLVGRDMPAMLAQFADHSYHSQLGWGTSLRQHLGPETEINGFEAENAHANFTPARAALEGGSYDAVVLTEMVEIADAIRYHGSAEALAEWAALIRVGNPNARIYLYETWHHTNDPKGWFTRIDDDLEGAWMGQILYPAIAKGNPVHLVPAGQVMAAVTRAVEAQGGVPGLPDRNALFALTPEGAQDTIHLSDLGAYLVALTHYAVLYHANPEGLPTALNRADGTPALAPSVQAAALMQRIVWEVVQRHPETGVAYEPA